MVGKDLNAEMTSFMMTMMSRMLQEQSAMNQMMVIERIDKFNGEDITEGATEVQVVLQINQVCTLHVRVKYKWSSRG